MNEPCFPSCVFHPFRIPSIRNLGTARDRQGSPAVVAELIFPGLWQSSLETSDIRLRTGPERTRSCKPIRDTVEMDIRLSPIQTDSRRAVEHEKPPPQKHERISGDPSESPDS